MRQGEFDEQADPDARPEPEDEIGFYVSPVAPTVSLEEARQEIVQLLGCTPPPPWLVQLQESAQRKHLDAALATLR
jgi:hypothetical protein